MNSILNANRNSYFEPNVNPNIYKSLVFPISVKHSTKVNVRESISNQFYGKCFKFDIPREGLLSGLTLEYNLSSAGDNTEVEDRLGNHIFKRIELRAVNGSKVICITLPEYQDVRMDEDITGRHETIVDPDIVFSGNSIKTFCPIYMFCFEEVSKFFNTEFVEDLELLVYVADDRGSMGLPAELSSLTIDLHCQYLSMDASNGPKDILAYNLFSENELIVDGTSSSSYLSVDRNVFATHVGLVKNRILKHITNFKITSSNQVIADMDFRLNTDVVRKIQSGNQYLTYFWSLFANRNSNTGFVNFNSMPPVTFEIEYAGDFVGYTKKCFHEYWFYLSIDRFGRIKSSL